MAVYYAGVDLGGTKIYAGVAGGQGQLLGALKVPTGAEAGYAAVLDRVAATVRGAAREAGVAAGEIAVTAVGVPGRVHPETGHVYLAPNLGWRDRPGGADLRVLLPGEVRLDNDANLAALGEHRFGAGRGADHMVFVTVSTGVGAGLVLDGRVYRGADFGAGELGHTIVAPGGPLCNCGRRGCLEAVASGGAIGRRARQLAAAGRGRRMLDLAGGAPDRISARTVFAAAAAGDAEALELVRDAAGYLGRAIANILTLLEPQRVVLGGGVMESGPLIWELIRAVVARSLPDRPGIAARLVPAALGDRMGLMGALALALDGAPGP